MRVSVGKGLESRYLAAPYSTAHSTWALASGLLHQPEMKDRRGELILWIKLFVNNLDDISNEKSFCSFVQSNLPEVV